MRSCARCSNRVTVSFHRPIAPAAQRRDRRLSNMFFGFRPSTAMWATEPSGSTSNASCTQPLVPFSRALRRIFGRDVAQALERCRADDDVGAAAFIHLRLGLRYDARGLHGERRRRGRRLSLRRGCGWRGDCVAAPLRCLPPAARVSRPSPARSASGARALQVAASARRWLPGRPRPSAAAAMTPAQPHQVARR